MMSSPTARRAAGSSERSHSRTGSLPPGVAKNRAGSRLASLPMVYQFWCEVNRTRKSLLLLQPQHLALHRPEARDPARRQPPQRCELVLADRDVPGRDLDLDDAARGREDEVAVGLG